MASVVIRLLLTGGVRKLIAPRHTTASAERYGKLLMEILVQAAHLIHTKLSPSLSLQLLSPKQHKQPNAKHMTAGAQICTGLIKYSERESLFRLPRNYDQSLILLSHLLLIISLLPGYWLNLLKPITVFPPRLILLLFKLTLPVITPRLFLYLYNIFPHVSIPYFGKVDMAVRKSSLRIDALLHFLFSTFVSLVV